MFTSRPILYALAFLSCLLTRGGDGGAALDRYNARLDEIAHSYKEQFTELRKNQRRIGAEKADFRATERQIEDLGMRRNSAIAEAKRIYQNELKQKEPDAPDRPRLSREERQRERMAARRQLFENGQKAFWQNVFREEPKIAELMAARRQLEEEELTAFWSELFEPPKPSAHDRTPGATQQTAVHPVQKQPASSGQNEKVAVRIEGRALAAAR